MRKQDSGDGSQDSEDWRQEFQEERGNWNREHILGGAGGSAPDS
jgi:hypothetical protein